MLRKCILLLLMVLAATSLAGAQFSRGGPKPVELVVRVFYEGEQHSAGARLTVQLMDGFGSLEGERITNEEGRVQFQTVSGIHRLRIVGPEIVEYNGNLEIETVEVRRVENVQVRLRTLTATVPRGNDSIPIARLKIRTDARKEFQKGSQALARKEWPEARKRFEAAVALYPEYDLAYNGLGVAAMSAGDVEGARRAFEKALSLNSEFAGANRNLARILLAERKYAEADTLLKKSLQSEPLNAWALTYASYAELQTRNFDDAIANARKVHTLPHEGFANAHFIAARALEATQREQEALAEYALYLKEDPSGPNAKHAREAATRIAASTPK